MQLEYKNMATPTKKSIFRRQFIINPDFQYRMIGSTVFMGVLLVAALYFVNLYFFNRFITQGLAMGLPEDHVYFRFIAQQKAAMSQGYAGVAACVLVFLTGWGVFISHRIAGPVYRLCTDLKAIAKEGVTRKLAVRKNDFFPELADAINIAFKTKKD